MQNGNQPLNSKKKYESESEVKNMLTYNPNDFKTN